jgi:hypothetical protein
VWRPSTGVIHSVFDQIPNLQNCFTTPNKKPRSGGGLRQINTFRKIPLQVNFFRIKKRRSLGFGVFIVIWSMHCTEADTGDAECRCYSTPLNIVS